MSSKTKSADLIVALTGASGAIYCIRLLEALKETEIRTHLVMSKWGIQTLKYETSFTAASVRRLADECYSDNDLGATISSGSFQTMGMVIVPCSAKTLGSIAHGAWQWSYPARGGRRPERTPQARAGGAGNAAERHPSRKHAEAFPGWAR